MHPFLTFFAEVFLSAQKNNRSLWLRLQLFLNFHLFFGDIAVGINFCIIGEFVQFRDDVFVVLLVH
jgi:hypothetical protein